MQGSSAYQELKSQFDGMAKLFTDAQAKLANLERELGERFVSIDG